MKFSDMLGNKQSCLIDHPSFNNHKFFLAFDMREAENIIFSVQGAQRLHFESNWLYNIPQGAGGTAAAPAAGQAPGTNNGYNGRFLAEAPVGPCNIWFFIFQERAVKVIEKFGSVTVVPDVLSDN